MTVTASCSKDRRLGRPVITLLSGLKGAGAQARAVQARSVVRRYDEFGNAVTAKGKWNGPSGYRSEAEIPPNPEHRGEGNESRLVGRNRDAGGFGYQEDATGLKLLGHRYYDSSTGRFLTRDPQKDGRNWYTYCWNDPISWMDADGQAPDGTFDPFNPNYYARNNPPGLRYPGPGGKDEKKPPATGGGEKTGPGFRISPGRRQWPDFQNPRPPRDESLPPIKWENPEWWSPEDSYPLGDVTIEPADGGRKVKGSGPGVKVGGGKVKPTIKLDPKKNRLGSPGIVISIPFQT